MGADLYESRADERLEFLRRNAPFLAGRAVFMHYKGGVYIVEYDTAVHTEIQEAFVAYRHLWPHNDPCIRLRPRGMFYGSVILGNGPEPRFRRVDFGTL